MNRNSNSPPQMGITIDDVTSRDLDDAFWIEEYKNAYVLKIFISDPTSRVNARAKDKTLYSMAYTRVRTQYYAQRNDPMLPIKLSENLLSLLPKRIRKVVCFELRLRKDDLSVSAFRMYECKFKSIQRLDYMQVHKFIAEKAIETIPDKRIRFVLETADKIATKLLQQRRTSGALIVYDALHGLTINEEGAIVRVKKDGHRGYIIIQELMILTNQSVAKLAAEKNIPMVYRTHRIQDANTQHKDLVQEFAKLEQIQDINMLQVMQNRIALMLSEAKYEGKHGEHWALSLPWYVHITSPIRRLADLVNMHNIVAHIRETPYVFSNGEVASIATHINATVKRQEQARIAKYKVHNSQALLSNDIGEYLKGLEPRKFSQHLKEIARSTGTPSDAFVEELLHRVSEDRIEIRDFVLLLFEEKFNELKEIRTKALLTLLSDRVRIKTMYYQTAQLYHIPVPEVIIAPNGELFDVAIKFTYGEKTYELGPEYGSSKKEASERIYELLLRKMFGVNEEVISVGEIKPAKIVLEKLCKEFKLLPVANENYISALMESSQLAQIELPKYDFQQSEQTVPYFTCNVLMVIANEEKSARGSGANKKTAKASAAKALYEILES